MSASQLTPWSDNPVVPKTPQFQYRLEKSNLAGTLVGSILYGVLTILFFNCMAALFNPTYRGGEGIKWGLMSYTVIMFSLATVYIATSAHILSASYIDNRDFPHGPYMYAATSFKAVRTVSSVAFRLNNWLADGLLLYRCYLFYSTNLWVIAFPLLMYLGSVVMGILTMCPTWIAGQSFIPQLSISLLLNVLLTFMIVARLVLHCRSVRAITGSPAGTSGLYKSIAAMLIESSALYAVSVLLVIILYGASNPVVNVFPRVLAETQVIASLLIIQQVAIKSASTSNTTAPGSTSPLKARTRGRLTSGSDALPSEYSVGSVGDHWTSPGKVRVMVETVIDIRRDDV